MLGDRLRRLEIRRQECVGDTARQFRMVFVDNGDRSVAHFLHTALRLRDDGKRERIDDQRQQDKIARKAPQFLCAEPEDVGERSHSPTLA